MCKLYLWIGCLILLEDLLVTRKFCPDLLCCIYWYLGLLFTTSKFSHNPWWKKWFRLISLVHCIHQVVYGHFFHWWSIFFVYFYMLAHKQNEVHQWILKVLWFRSSSVNICFWKIQDNNSMLDSIFHMPLIYCIYVLNFFSRIKEHRLCSSWSSIARLVPPFRKFILFRYLKISIKKWGGLILWTLDV